MNPILRKTLQYVVFLSLGVGLMWWAYKDTPFNDILASIKKAKWEWIALALLLNYTATIIRGIRWNILLEPLGHRADTWTCIHSVAFGYFMNDLIPRSGEFARCGLLNRAEKIPVDKLFGTVVLERIVDILMLGGFLLLALWFKNDELNQLFSKVDGGKGTFLLILVALTILGIISLVVFLRMVKHKAWAGKMVGFFRGMYKGFRAVFMIKRKVLFFVYTFAIWGTWLVMTQVTMFALEETELMNIGDSIFLMVAASLAMLVPTQGGLGAYHFATREAFVVLGQTPFTGLAFAWISWTCKTVLEIVVGTIGFFVVTRIKMQKK
ncbi:MAG: lysylphosphatidylglycerol synthase transmembrane domain-containing protein [Flavobacteriales bacterium]|nr:lysylphosphatidylglycerol synthase transmembrane domain-containing protein [Flavobacteriales bacterium]